MPYQTVSYTLEAGMAVVTLNRPDVLNALNSTLRAEITAAMHRAAEEARVVVLTGAGRAFCAGQDLSEGVTDPEMDLGAVLRDEYEPMLAAIYSCPVPTIAAVNGVAAGAGANLALAADVVIAAESASFVQAFARIGLLPDAGGTFWLPRQVGAARAMGAALFTEPVPAARAVEWGMIWEAVPDDAFDAHWRARARHLANGPTVAYRAIKTALRGSWSRDLAAQLDLEADLQGACGASEDFREGVTAFLEKRPPRYQGR
ncbi:enoyl-CoA hydratase-related protein [Phaeovulum vinaykumarii]|uniref:2-(1,2-epoxy-1,2-dihydrophenyl)acetyl-CoA isomerase n=1 Tax=Phaeovulum vinaykumarii TaxID=407234 RepID=A0A1N7KUA0_9RHOB|nr:enoyl-CoA hydratase-related protein [Phaeovulum vinaykumarii]SIS65169.1 2-(1,2-epoxy-1,2-dihydrophenyl)acetyl-CoA isomerase [Phaeovulum vinaykumarii]SOC01378.1 2-(1,2-epoxy-1,2-dihydrophenyl)acetyl-CoA isomerase [Phaeovulum vinaykumarii]